MHTHASYMQSHASDYSDSEVRFELLRVSEELIQDYPSEGHQHAYICKWHATACKHMHAHASDLHTN